MTSPLPSQVLTSSVSLGLSLFVQEDLEMELFDPIVFISGDVKMNVVKDLTLKERRNL